MAFIRQIEHAEATGDLLEFYDELAEIAGGVPNIVKLSSLKLPAMRAAQNLYQSVLYHESDLTMVEKEVVSTLVSAVNGCAYCVAHHGAAVTRLSGSSSLASWVSFTHQQAELGERAQAMLRFADKLTRDPGAMARSDADALRDVGLDDEAILDLVQLIAYFNYTNRLATALGVDPEGESESRAEDR